MALICPAARELVYCISVLAGRWRCSSPALLAVAFGLASSPGLAMTAC